MDDENNDQKLAAARISVVMTMVIIVTSTLTRHDLCIMQNFMSKPKQGPLYLTPLKQQVSETLSWALLVDPRRTFSIVLIRVICVEPSDHMVDRQDP